MIARMQRSLIRLLTRPEYRKFVAATKNPERAADEVWEEIRALLRKSLFWKEAYRDRLQDYDITTLDHYQSAIQESLRGGVSLLNQEPVAFWSQSAGTTGACKLFPMTSSFRRQFQRTIAPMVHGLIRNYPNFLKYPGLYFVATDPDRFAEGGIGIGYISNYNYRTIPGIIKNCYAFPRELLRDGKTFARFSPVYALASDLSAMFAVTPLSFRHLIQRIHDNAHFILSCLEGDQPLDPGLPRPRVSRRRLAHLSSCLRAGELRFRRLWPSLEFVCTWKTAVCASHLKEISPYLEGVDVVDAIYSATEGWVNVPVIETGGSVVHPGAHIFEFIPMGREVTRENLVPAWDLVPGECYEIFLTTAMGMVRYRLYDIVRCTGFFHRSPMIEFVQKSGSMISLGLVTVSESEILQSFSAAGLEVSSTWRVGPNKNGNGLTLYLDSAPADLASMLDRSDEHLRSINVNYRTYAANGTIEPISYGIVPQLQATAAGEQNAQAKPVLLIQKAPA